MLRRLSRDELRIDGESKPARGEFPRQKPWIMNGDSDGWYDTAEEAGTDLALALEPVLAVVHHPGRSLQAQHATNMRRLGGPHNHRARVGDDRNGLTGGGDPRPVRLSRGKSPCTRTRGWVGDEREGPRLPRTVSRHSVLSDHRTWWHWGFRTPCLG